MKDEAGFDAAARLPRYFVIAVVLISVLPMLLILLGVNFDTGRAVSTEAGFASSLSDGIVFLHALMEWSAFGTAVFTLLLSFAFYHLRGDPAIVVIALALFAAGSLDAFHILAGSGLINSVADRQDLIAFTWAISRGFNGLIIIVGVSIILLRGRTGSARAGKNLTLFVMVSLSFFILAYLLVMYCATSPQLPLTMHPGTWLSRPWDIGPLLLFVFLLVYLLPKYHRHYPGLFAHSLIISMIPAIATEMHMAFGSAYLYDQHFNSAHLLKIIAYLVPFCGLLLEYIATHKRQVKSSRELIEREHLSYIGFDYAPIGVALSDAEGNWLRINRAFAEMTGYTQDELLEIDYVIITHPDDRTKDAQAMEAFLQGRSDSINFEKRFLHKDDHYVWVSLTASAIRDDAGKILYYASQMQDISLQKQTEANLASVELQLQAFINNAPAVITLKDADGVYRLANSFAMKRRGVEPRELIGRTAREVLPAETADIVEKQDRQAAQSGRAIITEMQDGANTFVRNVFPVFNESGELCYIGNLSLDITAQKKVEKELTLLKAQLRALLDYAPVTISLKDVEGRYILMNALGQQFLGKREEDIVGKKAEEIFSAEACELILQVEKQVLENNMAVANERRHITETRDITLSAISFPVRDAEDKVTGVGTVTFDITARKQVEADFLEQTRRVDLLQRISAAINEANVNAEAVQASLDLLCDFFDWQLGHIVFCEYRDDSSVAVPVPGRVWNRHANTEYAELKKRLQEAELLSGESLTERTLAGDKALTFGEGQAAGELPAFVAEAGFRGAYALPVKVSGQVVAVFEFFSLQAIEMDAGITQLFESISTQFSHILQREQARQEVSWILQRLTYHIDNSPIAVIELNKNLQISRWNKKCEEVFGWQQEEALGKTPLQLGMTFLDEEDAEQGRTLEKFIKDAQTELHVNRSNYTKSGRIIKVEWHNSALHNANGGLESIISFAIDRTEQEQAQRALLESEKRFEMAVQASNDGIFDSNYLTGQLWLSDRMWEILGYLPGEIPVSTEIFQNQLIHPDDRESIARGFISHLKAGKPLEYECRVLNKNGRYVRTLTLASSIRDEQGRLLRVIGAVSDITAMQQAEEQRRIIFETASSGMVMVNTAGKIMMLNSAMVKLFGYKQDEMLGQSIEMLVPLRYQRQHVEHRKLYLAQPQTRAMGKGAELYGLNKNGTEFPVEINVSPVEAEDGLWVIATIIDISARKQAELELKRHADELQRSNKELEQFAYVASHDLQEPLRMVASFTELLARRYKDQLDERANEYIGFAIDGAKRMQGLINDLLHYSRVGSNGGEFGPVDCTGVFANVTRDLSLMIDDAQAEISCEDLPVVNGDAVQLTQLFQNLLINAIKYVESGKNAVIHVAVEEESAFWKFSVADNGIGIAEQHRERVFIIFQRLHGKSEYSGSGIGLAICKKIVERHGGTIWVEAGPQGGSVFYFTLAKKT